jgi:uncharacterized protein (DUF2141 family)
MLFSRSRRVFLLTSISVFVLGNLPLLGQSPGPATVTVKITGLRSEKGQVKIAVFNSSASWLGDHPAYSSTIEVDSRAVIWKLTGVPYGEYGLAVFHDENKNGKMDKNGLGIPQEAYGFSNNMRVIFGPPKWEKSKVVVNAATTDIAIEVK